MHKIDKVRKRKLLEKIIVQSRLLPEDNHHYNKLKFWRLHKLK